jgi:hypothetical protein
MASLRFLNEKVGVEYAEAVPHSVPDPTREGILVVPVADLDRMKLTSYRLEDRVHIRRKLPKLLLDRLAEIRANESPSLRGYIGTGLTIGGAADEPAGPFIGASPPG